MISKDTVQSAKNNPIWLARLLFTWLSEQGKYLVMGMIDKELYIYNGKFYELLDDTELDKIFYNFIVEFNIETVWKSSKLSELRRAMLSSPDCKIIELDADENYICLANGVLNIETMKFTNHNQNYYLTTYVDVEYSETSTPATKFVNFLNSCFTDQLGKIDADTVRTLVDIGGYLLYPKNQMHKMFMFLGEGANGKSLLLQVYSMFFDKSRVSSVPLEFLSNSDSFLRTPLLTSRINICAESRETSMSSEEIKKIISGEGITVNRKHLGVIDVIPRTKIIVASNTRPHFNDTTNGIYRRLHIIEFKNKFVPQKEFQLIKNARQKRIFLGNNYNDMLDDFRSEKNSIFFLFLMALKRLRQRAWELEETENSKAIKDDYKESNDTLGTWLTQEYETNEAEFVVPMTATEVLQDYRSWYRENVSEKPLNMSAKTMGSKIRDLFRVDYIKFSKGGKTVAGFPIKRIIYDNDLLESGDDSGEEPTQLQMAASIFGG